MGGLCIFAFYLLIDAEHLVDVEFFVGNFSVEIVGVLEAAFLDGSHQDGLLEFHLAIFSTAFEHLFAQVGNLCFCFIERLLNLVASL